jgi:RNAse (barnase) inhibitor barstar
MTDFCQHLQNVDEAGAYCLHCPIEVLRANAALADFEMFEVDLIEVHSKGEFLATVAKSIQAPDWFGHNFDALADALADFSWLDSIPLGYVLLLRNGGDTLGLTEMDHDILMGIFQETTEYWKTQGKPFWVFFA